MMIHWSIFYRQPFHKILLTLTVATFTYILLYYSRNCSKSNQTFETGKKYSLGNALSSRDDKECTECEERIPFRFPDVLLIGQKKCGTTAIRHFLQVLHPCVLVSNNVEVHFFGRLDAMKASPELKLFWYQNQWNTSCPSQLLFEKTPAYFHLWDVAARVREVIPDVKLMLMVCDPIRRVVSDYTMGQMYGRYTKKKHSYWYHPFKIGPIEDYLIFNRSLTNDFIAEKKIGIGWDLLGPSLLWTHMSSWLKHFPDKERYHFIDGNNFKKDAVDEIKKIEKFLNLPSVASPSSIVKQGKIFCPVNSKTGEKKCIRSSKNHTTLSAETEAKIKSFLKPEILQFCDFVNNELSLCHNVW